MIDRFKKANYKELLPIVLIILAGAFLRLYRIRDYQTFLGDEGRDVLVVYGILHGHPTLLGPVASVGGFFLGPIYYYIMTPFLLLSRFDPVGPAVMVVLFALATIYLIYHVGREFFDEKAALIAALFFATSPVVVDATRSSWNPNIMPFFSLASLYCVYKAVERKSRKLFLLTGFLLGIAIQLHYLATFLGFTVFIYVLIVSFRLKINWLQVVKNYLIMFAGFLIGFSPFLMFEVRHLFINTRNVIKFIFQSGDTGVGGNSLEIAHFAFNRMFGGLVFNYPIPRNFYQYPNNVITLWLLIFSIASLAAIAYFLYRFKESKDKNKYILFTLWGALGIILFGLYKNAIYDYYLGYLFPLPFFIFGVFFSGLMRSNLTKVLVGIAIAFLVLLNFNFSHLRHQPNRLINQTKTISDFVIKQAGGRPYNFALISKSNTDDAYRYFMKLEHKDPVTIQPPQVDPQRKTVTDQLYVVCEDIACVAEGNPQWEVAGFGQAKAIQSYDVSVVKIYKLVHSQ